MATPLDIQLAWGFVFFWILHTIMKIPDTNVHFRFAFFISSYVMLVGG